MVIGFALVVSKFSESFVPDYPNIVGPSLTFAHDNDQGCPGKENTWFLKARLIASLNDCRVYKLSYTIQTDLNSLK